MTSAHGRRIGIKAAQDAGLAVHQIELNDDSWQLVWELYVRTDYFVSSKASKVVETKDHNFSTPKLP